MGGAARCRYFCARPHPAGKLSSTPGLTWLLGAGSRESICGGDCQLPIDDVVDEGDRIVIERDKLTFDAVPANWEWKLNLWIICQPIAFRLSVTVSFTRLRR